MPLDPPPRSPVQTRSSLLEWLVGGIAVLLAILALRLGRGWFVPMVIAWLAAIVLVATFERIGGFRLFGRPLPRWAVHLVGLLVVIGVVFGLTQVVMGQMQAFAVALPDYAARIADLKLRLDDVLGTETTEHLWELVESLRPSTALSAALNGAGAAFGTLVLIVLYVAFMLVDGGSLARKIAALGRSPAEQAHVAVALGAIREGVQQFMLVKTLISGGTAIIVYGLLRLIGVDFAMSWAALAFLLNFIPNIGSIVATALPVAWAAIQFPTFGPPLVTLLTVGSVQFIFGNVVDPMLSGRRLNLGPLIIILSLSFWSMLWGIAGAFLAVPMTVVLAIVALHVPPLRPLSVILSGDEPDVVARPAVAPAAVDIRPEAVAPRESFAADIANIRRDQARDLEAATAPPAAAAAAPSGGSGVSSMLQAGVAEWLGGEVAARTGLEAEFVEREIRAFLGQLAEDPDAYRAMLAGAGSEALDVVRRHPAAAALVAAALGFVLSRLRR